MEVAAAINRRTGSNELAERIAKDLQNIDNIYFLELFSARAENSVEIAVQTGLRGMGCIIVQAAKEFNAVLVTLDMDISKKVSGLIKIKNVDEF